MGREPFSIQRCRHYAGAGTACQAGIDPNTLRDDEMRVPCIAIRGITGALACDHLELDAGPPQAEPGSLSRALAALTSGCCPTCSEPMTGEYTHDDGRVYAMPCRHVIRSKEK